MAGFKIDDKPAKTTLVGADLYLLGDSADLSGTDKKIKKASHSDLLTYMQNNLSFTGTSIKYLTSADSPYTISDGDGFGKYICDTSSGDITITLPTLADNQNRELEFYHQTGGNLLTIDGEGAETIGNLSQIELPKGEDRLKIIGTTPEWVITEEKISCQLRLNTWAGYGSIDSNIMRFTNIDEDFGNMFSHNHPLYNGNTEGLEILINRNGKYSFSACCENAGYLGFSLNSPQLTTNIRLITPSDRLNINYSIIANSIPAPDWEGYLSKGDIVRVHGSAATSTQPSFAGFTATYLGN
jgi:hypothetical protein